MSAPWVTEGENVHFVVYGTIAIDDANGNTPDDAAVTVHQAFWTEDGVREFTNDEYRDYDDTLTDAIWEARG